MIANWWDGLTPREHIMLGVLGAVLALALVFVGIIQPVFAANDRARSVYERTTQNSAQFQRGMARFQLSAIDGETAGPAANPDTFRADIAPLARSFGLSVARLQPTNGDHLLVTFDQARPEDLYAFLVEARGFPGGQVVAASMTGQGDQTVNAVIEFRGAGQ